MLGELGLAIYLGAGFFSAIIFDLQLLNHTVIPKGISKLY